MTTSVLHGDETLRPARRWWLRFLIFLLLALLPLFSSTALHKRTIFAATMAAMLGSYPIARIKQGRFERVTFVAFVPVLVKRWSLDRFVSIETATRDPHALDTYMYSPLSSQWDFWLLMDFVFPWMSGEYKLWLRAASGRRVQVWEGKGEQKFRHNLDLLQKRSGLPIDRGSDQDWVR
jgi:hypothetical protein